ncbi:MAG: PaaI family thioesterase [Bacteroidota bacterium]
MDFVDDGKCFACGRENPIGLKLSFRLDGEGRAVATFVPGDDLQGFSGVLHGGIVCALMDEAMAWALILRGKLAVTVSLAVRFRKPVLIGRQVTVTGEVVRSGSKRHVLRADIRDTAGELAAEAEGTFLVVSELKQSVAASGPEVGPPERG